jgi:hypothetical protein
MHKLTIRAFGTALAFARPALTLDLHLVALGELAYLIIEYTVIILYTYHKYNLKDSY